jgi:hypothetical protein
MDLLNEMMRYAVREAGNVWNSLLGSEIWIRIGALRSEVWIREGLLFLGAVIGILAGYVLGKRAERRRWRTELHQGLRALRRALEGSKSSLRETR